MNNLKQKKIGFIGTGNLSQSIIRGLVESRQIEASQIYASNRSENRLKKVVEKFNINGVGTNEEVVEKTDIVILGMKPQDLPEAVESLANIFDPNHSVISVAAGITLDYLTSVLTNTQQIARVLCNIPVRVKKGMTGYCLSQDSVTLADNIETLFSPLGEVMRVQDDDGMSAFCVASSAGVGFAFEFMQYFQDWIEGYGFSKDEARLISAQTFLGAAELARSNNQMSFYEWINQVASKKGVTEAGLNSIRETDIERALRVSLEKAYLRDKELGLK